MLADDLDQNDEKIHSKEMLKAFRKLDSLLSKPLVDAIINSLKFNGVVFSDMGNTYSLNEILQAFSKMFGPEASELLLQRLKKELSSSSSSN